MVNDLLAVTEFPAVSVPLAVMVTVPLSAVVAVTDQLTPDCTVVVYVFAPITTVIVLPVSRSVVPVIRGVVTLVLELVVIDSVADVSTTTVLVALALLPALSLAVTVNV